jgi:hypothetical protein
VRETVVRPSAALKSYLWVADPTESAWPKRVSRKLLHALLYLPTSLWVATRAGIAMYRDVQVPRETGGRERLHPCTSKRRPDGANTPAHLASRFRGRPTGYPYPACDRRVPARRPSGSLALVLDARARHTGVKNLNARSYAVQATYRDVGRYDSRDGGGRAASGTAAESNAGAVAEIRKSGRRLRGGEKQQRTPKHLGVRERSVRARQTGKPALGQAAKIA